VNLRSPFQGLTVRDGPVKGVTQALQRQQRQDWDPQIELVGGKVRGPVGFAPAAAAAPSWRSRAASKPLVLNSTLGARQVDLSA